MTSQRNVQRRNARGRSASGASTLFVWAAAVLAVAAGSSSAPAEPPLPTQDWVRTEVREDCDDYNELRNPYFGDTHVHTKYSADAVLARTRNDPRDAYSFAQGGTVGLPPYDALGVPGRTATIDRPLHFTAVTDHSEGFGEASICLNPGYGDEDTGYNDPLCVDLRATFENEYAPSNPLPAPFIAFFTALNLTDPMRFEGICQAGPTYADCMTEAGIIWQDTRDAAEENYDRTAACSFTSFVAYEWSGNTNANNLHRNVIFRNDEVPSLPISYYEEWKPEGLWAQLQAQCLDAPGNCDVMAIPHNSNIARTGMFSRRTSDGPLMNAAQAATRAWFEPVIEVTQVKGDSECRDGVAGTSDELCGFEKLSRDTLIGSSDWDREFSHLAYVRGALKEGLILERNTGVNPFALGFVGGTDTHNGTSGATSEVDYGGIGFSGIADSSPAFILAQATPPSKVEANPGGLSVVWAEENSRDALFAAMRRRETYSTSGTRPIVRSFAGRYPLDLCSNPDFVAEGYDKGVPMGGDIGPERGKYSPRFAVMAQKDAGTEARPGTPLQRIQMIKGWIDDETGETAELVYEVAGDPNNGAGVDEATCAETGPGASSLCTVWEDPDFDPGQNAFYYARVVENPVCRWSKRLCNSLGIDCAGSVPAEYVECCDARIATVIQERAVASPVWYHANRVGIAKGRVSFKDEAGEDRLQLSLFIPQSPDELDPSVSDLTLTLRDDATVWTATIPAATMEVKKPGASYSYKDKTGAIAGITGLKVKISRGVAKITVKTGDIDLSGLARAGQKLALDLTCGSYSSTAEREWSYAAPKLSVVF